MQKHKAILFSLVVSAVLVYSYLCSHYKTWTRGVWERQYEPAVTDVDQSDYSTILHDTGKLNVSTLLNDSHRGSTAVSSDQDYPESTVQPQKLRIEEVREQLETSTLANTAGNHIKNQSNTLINSSNQAEWLVIQSPFSLPTPKASLPLPQLLQCDWLQQLRHFLARIGPRQLVSLVSSDFTYKSVLLNWLITALVKVDSPLSNVLVLSLDKPLCELLTSRQISCLYIPVSCLLDPGLSLEKHIGFTQVHIMRLMVMRLLNHWGYDVSNYDSDALILRNPETLFAQMSTQHLIGSSGHSPNKLDREWGAAVCIGTMLIRASHQTGY